MISVKNSVTDWLKKQRRYDCNNERSCEGGIATD